MKPAVYLTTSWDDGHPLDLRIAELLTKYGLMGTFYVPRTAEHGTMTAGQLRQLSGTFEIGAHTLHHVDLLGASAEQARQEITGSRSWVEDSTGSPCSMFCPPKGRFARRHLDFIQQVGYRGVRSVELLSLGFPQQRGGLMLMPTSVQAHPHGMLAYARNAIKRGAFRNLWRAITRACSTDWVRLTRSLLHSALERGGVFHLWGHSWELEQTGQWQCLEEVLRHMSQLTSQAPPRTNGEICNANGALQPLVASSEEAGR